MPIGGSRSAHTVLTLYAVALVTGEKRDEIAVKLLEQSMNIQYVVGGYLFGFAEPVEFVFGQVGGQLGDWTFVYHCGYETVTAAGGTVGADKPDIVIMAEDSYIGALVSLATDTALDRGN